MIARWQLGCGLFLVALAVCGCEDADLDVLQAHLDALRSKPQGRITALPDMPEYPVAIYDRSNRRSPFAAARPERKIAVETPPRPDADRPRQPLEAFELDNLALVGTLTVGDTPSGLIKAPDGKIHRVFIGDYLGRDYGRIARIEPLSLALVETVRGDQGAWVERPQRLDMARQRQADDNDRR